MKLNQIVDLLVEEFKGDIPENFRFRDQDFRQRAEVCINRAVETLEAEIEAYQVTARRKRAARES